MIAATIAWVELACLCVSRAQTGMKAAKWSIAKAKKLWHGSPFTRHKTEKRVHKVKNRQIIFEDT